MSSQSDDLFNYVSEPPSLTLLYETPVLRALYGKHMISVYCPENLMFRDAVEEMWALYDAGQEEAARKAIEKCFKTFCRSDSPLEVNFTGAEKKKIQAKIDREEFSRDIFDVALVAVDDDISRSLSSFWVTPIFLAYYQHKELLDDLEKNPTSLPDSNSRMSMMQEHVTTDRSQMLRDIRQSYNTREPVLLTRIFDVTSAFTYRVDSKDGDPKGWGVQRKGHFFFYDLEERLLTKVSASTLLGKAAVRQGTPRSSRDANDSSVDEDVASSGCFSRRPNKPSPVKTIAPLPLWYIVDSKGKEWGPLEERVIKLFWRYDALPQGTHVKRQGESKSVPLMARQDDIFDFDEMIQLIDPTQLASF